HVFGVLGFGGIGQAAARVMRSVGLKIVAINTSGRTTEKVDFIGTLDDLDLMKHDAILINVARGHVIDEQALYRHLAQNPGFSAGIDTWWIEPSKDGEFKVNYPFFDLPNFLGSPHNSSITPGTMANAARLAAQNAADFLSSGKIRGEIRKEDYVEE